MSIAQERCILGIWLLSNTNKRPPCWKSNPKRNTRPTVAGATLETFARWLHHRYAPVELQSAGAYRFTARATRSTAACVGRQSLLSKKYVKKTDADRLTAQVMRSSRAAVDARLDGWSAVLSQRAESRDHAEQVRSHADTELRQSFDDLRQQLEVTAWAPSVYLFCCFGIHWSDSRLSKAA